MTTKSRRFDLRTTPEVHDAIKAEAESQGVSVNVLIERVMAKHLAKPQVEDVRQGTVQAGAQDSAQSAGPDYGEQLERMEYNMDVLRQSMLSMAERQEVSMAAQAATMEAVRMLGEQVGQMMQPVLVEPAERHALPEPERAEDLRPRSDVRERGIARYFDEGHEHLQRLMAQGRKREAQVLLGRMQQRYGAARTQRELRRRWRQSKKITTPSA